MKPCQRRVKADKFDRSNLKERHLEVERHELQETNEEGEALSEVGQSR